MQKIEHSQAIQEKNKSDILENVLGLDSYIQSGGYEILRKLKNSNNSDKYDLALTQLENSALKGLGGAGFPTGKKWRIVKQQKGPRLMAVNADEGEPGTFKDRHYLSTSPHQIIEGILIAALIVGISECYLYVRDEYPEILFMLRNELQKLSTTDIADHTVIHLRRGAGAYICGEEVSND